MLNPSDSTSMALKTIMTMGAGWCPPGMLGIGIGGTAEGAAARQGKPDGADRHAGVDRAGAGERTNTAGRTHEKVNALGIGAQSGRPDQGTRREDPDYRPMRRLPVAMIPNCAATGTCTSSSTAAAWRACRYAARGLAAVWSAARVRAASIRYGHVRTSRAGSPAKPCCLGRHADQSRCRSQTHQDLLAR